MLGLWGFGGDELAGAGVDVPGKKSKKKDRKDKHGVGLQAKTVVQAMIWHWLTILDVPAVICSDRGSQFVGSRFTSMCKHMGIRHAKTVVYHSRSNGRAGSPVGKRWRSSANCTSRSRGGIGFTLFGGFYKPSVTYRGLRDCLRTAFYSYGIECLELSRG